MNAEMTTAAETITDEGAAFALYAETFGEKAAKRNAGRIARLAALVHQYGAGNVTLREQYTSSREAAARLAESGVVILGHTSVSTSKTAHVVAECHEGVAALEFAPAAATERQAVAGPPAPAAPPAAAMAPRPAGRGQLWQECRCGTEPVCAGCENCDRHCTCGAATAYVAGEIYGGDE